MHRDAHFEFSPHFHARADKLLVDEKYRLKLTVGELGSRNPAMARCLKLAALAAKSAVPVLILGGRSDGVTY